jgi:hypothetical protein
MSGLGDLADIARQTWREDAACLASGVEFVDVTEPTGRRLITLFCHACPVVRECREYGDASAPHAWPSVYGARWYDKREPRDGWPEDGAA